MRKAWLVAATTYRRRVRSGMFLILTFGLPLIMVVAGAIPVLRQRGGGAELPNVGYVDHTNNLAPVTQVTIEDAILNLTSFTSPDRARAAFQRGEIGGYLVIPGDYFQGGAAVFYGEEDPSGTLDAALTHFMRQAMLPERPGSVLDRLADPSELTYVAHDSGVRIIEGPAMIVRVGLPAALAILFALAVFTGASQMGAVIVREKEQRAMEMVVTSLAPRELVAGKVLGMTLLTLTQFGVWVVGGSVAAGLFLARSGHLGALSIPWGAVAWAIVLGVPAYFLYAVLAAGLGVVAGDSQQAQQLAGVLGFLGLAPLWLLSVVVEAPSEPPAVALTLFPLTGPMFGLMRMVLTKVPAWQLAASLGLSVVSLVAAVWAVARIFRAAMLVYGQALRPHQVLQALREA